MMDLRQGILATAQSLGIDPIDLGTAISYETAGTFDPTKAGPTTQWGQHRGLIQFGEPQAKQYGVDWNDPIGSQLGENGAVARYLRGAGVKPGMGMMDIYSAINAGSVGRYGASDANNGGAPGTVADKVNGQMAGHREKAMALLGNITGGGGNTMIAGNPQQDTLKPEGWLTQDRKDALIVGLEGMTMNPNEALVEMAGGRIKDRRAEAKSNAAKSKTTEWLRSIGRDDLAAAVESGSVDGGTAAGVAFTDKRAKEGTAEEQATRAAQGQSITAMGRPDLGQMVADGILSAAEAGKLALEGKAAPKPLSPEGMLAVDVKNGIVDPKVADPIDTADVDSLRKQWEGLGPTKSFAVQSEAFGRIQAAAKDPSAAGDLALIFSYMKMLDPGSVVREGEFANAQNAAGIPERIRAAYNNAMDGQRLTETTRTDFLSRADKLYAAAEQGYTALEGQYTATAKTRGYDPAQVVTDFRYSGPRLGLSSDGISTTTLVPALAPDAMKYLGLE